MGAGGAVDAENEDADVVKVKVEQQKLLERLDKNRDKYVRFVQEAEMLKFADDTTGMNYFDSIKRVIHEGKIEVNSLKKRFRSNLKNLKALEKSKNTGIHIDDSDEEN